MEKAQCVCVLGGGEGRENCSPFPLRVWLGGRSLGYRNWGHWIGEAEASLVLELPRLSSH